MLFQTKSDIVSHRILDDETGELKNKRFEEITKTKNIKGGFTMVYKDYDQAQLSVVKSNKDLEIFLFIKDMFTYKNTDVFISTNDISNKLKTGTSKVSKVIKDMRENQIIKNTSKGIYRLNPFMYIPYRANAEELQKEWRELFEEPKEVL